MFRILVLQRLLSGTCRLQSRSILSTNAQLACATERLREQLCYFLDLSAPDDRFELFAEHRWMKGLC